MKLELRSDVRKALEEAADRAGVPLLDYIERVLERDAAINSLCIREHQRAFQKSARDK
jgi:hypothetical protein